ncbi:MAG TPA: GH92 family glycosyl hydrolase [Actinomycetota bacterium]|nr:GH92 family glycosyl hydrolase [Actinomycetota bacterium]
MRRLSLFLAALALASVLPSGAAAQTAEQPPTDYVDPMIGTLGGGFVFPGAAAPYGMVQLSPDTEGYLAYTGYHYHDQFIRGFSHHHIESMGVKSNGNLPFLPSVGPVTSNDPRTWMSPYNHATEEASPGYYKVMLERGGITAELTAGTRVGMHRYTFPPGSQSNVILDIGRSNKTWEPWNPAGSLHQSSLEILDDRTIVGFADSDQGYTIHFAAEFDRPFASHALWGADGVARPGVAAASGLGAGGYVSFDTTSDADVQIKVGISFVDRDNARANLAAEKPDWSFEDLRAKTVAEWNRALSTIQVGGGTDADKTSFYTALYHAQHHPNVFNDVNGEYRGYDGAVHTVSGRQQYANFSLWDTYRGENQLLATIDPARYREMMLSLLEGYRQVGRFPQWAMNNAYPDFMVGDPVQPTVVDGYCRGVFTEAEADEMYAALADQAFTPALRAATQGGYDEYLSKGYISDRASETLEFALADFSLALMADSLGHDEQRDALLKRAGNFANVIDPDSGFARPRNADGTWRTPYSPEEPDHFVEGTGWQYTWLAPQDLRGLFNLIGGNGRAGDDTVRERLDTFFSTALSDAPGPIAEVQQKITLFGIFYAGNQYAPSNEHDLHAPYLYDYAGEPWKTQKIMRGYQALFRPTPDGMPGNDDLGSMSAWYIWSALGFYPVTGGAPVYAVGSPVFEEARIAPIGGGPKVTVSAPGASPVNRYITSASLGEAALARPWFTHDELFDEGQVSFSMSPTANEEWGAAAAAAPPSMTGHPLAAFGCPGRIEAEPEATTLVYTGDTTGRGSQVNLEARLTTVDGSPVAGKTIEFRIGDQVLNAVTDAGGTAAILTEIADHGRSQEVTVSFAGDAGYGPATTTATISWGRPR